MLLLMSHTCTIPIFAYVAHSIIFNIIHSADRLQCTMRTPLINQMDIVFSRFGTVITLAVKRNNIFMLLV